MPTKLLVSAMLAVTGAGLLVGGIAVISTPIAIIVAGLLFLGFAVLLARQA